MNRPCLRLLLVDDEPLARTRLRQLLDDIAAACPTVVVAEASDGVEALAAMDTHVVDAALVDIRMPRMDGLQLALHASRRPHPPAIVFITAFDQYAVKAFELAAADYLLKPVKAQRLQAALDRIAERMMPMAESVLRQLAPEGRHHLRSSERGRVHLIAVADILYLKAGQKYVTARTQAGEYLLEESLAQLEREFGERFIRVHRNCLVAQQAIVGYEHGSVEELDGTGDLEPGWQLRLRGVADKVAVSRRQWPHVRALFKE